MGIQNRVMMQRVVIRGVVCSLQVCIGAAAKMAKAVCLEGTVTTGLFLQFLEAWIGRLGN